MSRIGFIAAVLATAAAPLAHAAVADGGDCGGFTATQAAAWLKASPAHVTREVTRSGERWVCTFALGKTPTIAFSVGVSSTARRASDDLERYRDQLAAQGESATWRGKLPNGVYSDLFGAGDEAVWTDINGTTTVRRDNVTVQFTLPRGKETQVELAKAVVQGF
jgi:hypothetical protein